MTDFRTVRDLLDAAVGTSTVAVHGRFWNTMTRDEFVNGNVLGLPLVVVNHAARSNLVKALRGLSPFGLGQGTAGARFNRMPAGRPAMADADIRVIEAWINAGCPAGRATGRRTQTPAGAGNAPQAHRGALTVNPGGTITLDDAGHMRFWREFDDWAQYNRTQAVTNAIGAVFQANRQWMANVVAGRAAGPVHDANSLTLLANAQKNTLAQRFGDPLPLLTVYDSFEKFGADEFPNDPQHPGSQAHPNRHNMDSPGMWLNWAGFCEGCITANIEPTLWRAVLRCVLLGTYHDWVVRGQIRARRPMRRDQIRPFVKAIADADLISASHTLLTSSGLVGP